MDKASVYGTGDCRFESYQGQLFFTEMLASVPSFVRAIVNICISGLVVEYIVAIDVTRVRFPADAICHGKRHNVTLHFKIVGLKLVDNAHLHTRWVNIPPPQFGFGLVI